MILIYVLTPYRPSPYGVRYCLFYRLRFQYAEYYFLIDAAFIASLRHASDRDVVF